MASGNGRKTGRGETATATDMMTSERRGGGTGSEMATGRGAVVEKGEERRRDVNEIGMQGTLPCGRERD